MMTNDKKPRLVYGRRRGKPLSVSRTEVMENLYPVLAIPRDILKQDKTLSPANIFDAPVKTLHIEIGFGNGEHLKWRMEKNPDDHFIGAEIFRDGVAAFLKSIKDEPHGNTRVWMDDALIVLNSLPDASVDFIYVLNPDPWPKARHHHRRMIIPENLEVFARVMKPGAILLETTDVAELADWMASHTVQSPHFEYTQGRAEDWYTPPDGWMATRYENKGKMAGRRQAYLMFRRK